MLHDYHQHLSGGVTLLPGTGGIFEVTLGNRSLYSKRKTGRFPEPGEVEQALAAALDVGARGWGMGTVGVPSDAWRVTSDED